MKLVIDISEHDYDWIRRWAKDGTQVPVYDTLAKYIANGKVLSEEQEHKTGKWIKDGHHIRCNRCDEYMCETDREGDKIPTNFCPNCGAEMEVEDG